MKQYLWMVLFSVASAPVWARDPQLSLTDGLSKEGLAERQRTLLKEFLQNTENELKHALEQGRELALDDAEAYYRRTLDAITIASGDRKPFDELISRIALNQGRESATLAGQSLSRGIGTVIYERSIDLALRFIEADRSAAKQLDFKLLPYLPFALDRARSCLYWIAQVQEPGLRDQLAYGCAEHFVAVIALSGDAAAETKRLGRPLAEMDAMLAEKRVEGAALHFRAWLEEFKTQQSHGRGVTPSEFEEPRQQPDREVPEAAGSTSFLSPEALNGPNFGVSGWTPVAKALAGITTGGGNGRAEGALVGFQVDGSLWKTWGYSYSNHSGMFGGAASRLQMLFAPTSSGGVVVSGEGSVSPLMGALFHSQYVDSYFAWNPVRAAFARDVRLTDENHYAATILLAASAGIKGTLFQSGSKRLTLEGSAAGATGGVGTINNRDGTMPIGGHIEGQAALSFDAARFNVTDTVRASYMISDPSRNPDFLSLQNHVALGIKSGTPSRFGAEVGYLWRRNSLERVIAPGGKSYTSSAVTDHFVTLGVKFQ